MIAQRQKHYYSPQEYLELEENAEFKHEYHDGEITEMTGGTTNHNTIALNFCTNFKFTMKGKNYQIYINDVRLWIPEYRRYTYPDVMIVGGKPIYEGENTTTINNPSVIIEVLSDSTKNYDRGEKFRFYRSLESLQEYILIDQYSYYVEQFIKESSQEWKFKEYMGESNILSLTTIDFEITLNELYETINFEIN
jgi:Uma2 family endonuclease